MYKIRFEQLLREHGKSVSELAAHCGVSLTAAYNWIEGAEPRPGKRAKIANFFGMPEAQLYQEPILSLSPIRSTMTTTHAAMTIMIANEMTRIGVKSQEFQDGMRSRLQKACNNQDVPNPYEIGTAAHDAFNAGYEAANRMGSGLAKQ